MRIACCRCDSLISASLLEQRRSARRPSAPSRAAATRTACSRVASRVPISRSLVALATWIDLLALGLGDADLARLLLLGHVDPGLLDRLRRRLLADRLDVADLVGDVGDVDVDQHQADLLQLRLQRVLDVLQELVAVAVDVLDPHRGDHLPQLAEDDFLGLLLDLVGVRGRAGGWPRSASSPGRCRWRR